MKKTGIVLVIILLVTSGWYFFIKPSDYTVNFEVKTSVGAVNQTLKLWHSSLEEDKSLTQKSLGSLEQIRHFGDSIHTYQWDAVKKDDSVVKVRMRVTDEVNSLANRWSVITGGGSFVRRAKKSGEEFFQVMVTHLDKIKVTIDGEENTPETYYAYVTEKGLQSHKAGGMMRNFNFVTGLMLRNGVTQKGSPFVEVLKWDQETDSIHYNFCFPVIRSENMPQHPDVKYGKRYSKRALKATYNGNYITSDRAWYALMEYAEKNNIDLVLEPLEVFYNNPQMGGNEESWKTEVYMPIRE